MWKAPVSVSQRQIPGLNGASQLHRAGRKPRDRTESNPSIVPWTDRGWMPQGQSDATSRLREGGPFRNGEPLTGELREIARAGRVAFAGKAARRPESLQHRTFHLFEILLKKQARRGTAAANPDHVCAQGRWMDSMPRARHAQRRRVLPDARVAKLADALDLGSSGVTLGGSSPPSRITRADPASEFPCAGREDHVDHSSNKVVCNSFAFAFLSFVWAMRFFVWRVPADLRPST